MGSVPDLYTTGDNDPELEPVSYYRHYLYCDGCGAFELDRWGEPDDPEALERTRRLLGRLALCSALVALVWGLRLLGFLPILSLLALVIAGGLFLWVERAILFRSRDVTRERWNNFRFVFPWVLLIVAAEVVAGEFFSPVWILFVGALFLVVGLSIARGILGSKIHSRGLRCRQCQATYGYGTPFFTDLDANPRNLTVEVVPRPLGVSPFEIGKSVAREPGESRSRLAK